jgi:hypothetical protein
MRSSAPCILMRMEAVLPAYEAAKKDPRLVKAAQMRKLALAKALSKSGKTRKPAKPRLAVRADAEDNRKRDRGCLSVYKGCPCENMCDEGHVRFARFEPMYAIKQREELRF